MELRDLRASDGDGDDSLAAFAARNPGLCIVGTEDDRIVGSALAGFDGRGGWLYHVATDPDMRRRGVATRLVRTVKVRLQALGCRKLNLIVRDNNAEAMRFWESIGYERDPTVKFSQRLVDR